MERRVYFVIHLKKGGFIRGGFNKEGGNIRENTVNRFFCYFIKYQSLYLVPYHIFSIKRVIIFLEDYFYKFPLNLIVKKIIWYFGYHISSSAWSNKPVELAPHFPKKYFTSAPCISVHFIPKRRYSYEKIVLKFPPDDFIFLFINDKHFCFIVIFQFQMSHSYI